MNVFSIEELAEAQPVDDLVRELHPLFTTEFAKGVEALEDAQVSGDISAMARLCRRLQGAAALYGYKRLSEHLTQAEGSLLCGALNPQRLVHGLRMVSRCLHGTGVEGAPQLAH